jgi:cytochrome c oxidase cbb3-type subunit 1
LITAQLENYNFGVVRGFVAMAVIYLLLGTLLGVYMALELALPGFFPDIPYLSFGRLRPLQTLVVLFAFGGCAIMAAAFYSVQRTSGVRLWSNTLAWIVFWGWNLIMAYVIGRLHFGPLYTDQEHATLKRWIDIATALVWATFFLNFVMTIASRKVDRIYISNWFFMGMTVMIAGLYLVSGASILVSPTDTYNLFSGIQDSKQDHSTLAFFLTAGFLGALYYILPQQANRPIYSYRLAVIHFWALMIVCLWVGIQHQTYITPPAQFGIFGSAVLLIMFLSSLGAVINCVLTLTEGCEKPRKDYIRRFLLFSLALYALSFILTPNLPTQATNVFSYTNWTLSHGLSTTIGWIVIISCGAVYHMVEKLWNTRMFSARLVNLHLWLFATGAVIHMCSMYIAGIMQGLMWSSYDEYGNLAYTFAESVEAMQPYYFIRILSEALFFAGVVFMLYNTTMTVLRAPGQPMDNTETAQAP